MKEMYLFEVCAINGRAKCTYEDVSALIETVKD